MNIQNCACLEFIITPNDSRVNIIKDILRGKKINSIYVFCSTDDNSAISPISNEQISNSDDIRDVSLFYNLFDKYEKLFVKEFSLNNTILNTDDDSFIEYTINRILDLDLSFINTKTQNLGGDVRFLIYVFYQTESKYLLNDEVNGSITIGIKTNPLIEIQDFLLSDYINNDLKDKKIKQIRFDGDVSGYIDIIGLNNRKLDNFPLQLLSIRSNKEFYFDPIEIDFEKSYFRKRSFEDDGKISYLTFIY